MSTALYRRYRPETFQDVIGQEHVTEPLMTALQNNRVNHAYLFSGPRGCGKTTSARILARCLNCAEGPTPTPCGHCESCRDLARDGAGSLDVIEMDAASHGGVDHARDLRERATFAPVRDRYKIFIIDEAHMVTREGFNALLKIVEEPPEHIKFVFATTEPNKVLGTIRSRTHHYPFRLVAPEVLRAYLQRLCEDEGVAVEQGVLPLVVRAGGGSVRDSLSVLDQLMGGSGPEGITYDLAVALLGFTHAELLDGVVDAFAAGDSPAVFQAVDRVIQTGQDPRRFVEDLLERFRDLIIVKAVPDSAAQILHGMPEDQIDRMKGQAHQMGAAELSRAADITNQALTEMIGATSPQLHLELLCARILLPTADDSSRGVNARVDRLERRINLGTVGAVQAPLQADPASVMTPETPAEHAAAEGLAETGMQAGGGREAALAMARRTRQDSENRPESRPEGSGSTEDGTAHDDARGRRSSAPADPSRGTGGQNHAAPEDAAAPGRETAGPGTPETRSGHQPPSQGETAAPPRGPNRPDPAQDAEDAHGRGPERPQKQGNGPRDDEASGYHPQPTAAPDAGQVNLVARSWTDVVAAVGHHSKVAQATFRECRPARFENGVLYVQSAGPGIQSRVERYAGACAAALQETLGIDCRVAVDGSGPQDAPEGPGGSGGPGGSRGPSGPQGGPSGSAQGSVQRTRDGGRNGSSGDRWGGQPSGRLAPDDASGTRPAETPRGARDQNDPDWPDDQQWQEAARRAQDQEARSAGASDSSNPSGRRSVPSENTADAEPTRPAASGPAELPEGPRSGEDAWKQHGEPLGSEDPEWSEDAEGETFTGWAVARIPDGPEDDAETPENPPQDDARAAGRTADDGTETPQTDEGPNPSGPEAGSEPPTDTARLRVLSGQGGRAAQSDPADPRAAASLTVVPPLGEEDDREQTPAPAVDASETLGENSVDAAASSADPSESGPRPPAHDWAVAARNAGAPGAPVDGRDCGWGFSGPTQGADHRDHPSRWGQRAPHLASVAPEPQEPGEHAEPEQPTGGAPGRQDATSEDAERHLHAVPARQEPAEDAPNALPPEDRMPSAGSPAEGRPASGGAEEHRPFHERYADQIAAGAAHGVAPGRGSSARRGPVDPNAPEPPDDDWDAFVPAPEDEDLEDSAVYGQAAVETILGGRVLEERPHHQQ